MLSSVTLARTMGRHCEAVKFAIFSEATAADTKVMSLFTVAKFRKSGAVGQYNFLSFGSMYYSLRLLTNTQPFLDGSTLGKE